MAFQKKVSCRFPGCTNAYYWCRGEKVENKHFYRFPRNSAVLIKWKSICDIDVAQDCYNKFVCEDHFQQTDFVNFTKHALNPFAVPSRLETESNSSFVCNESHAIVTSIDATDNNNNENSSIVNNVMDNEKIDNILIAQTTPKKRKCGFFCQKQEYPQWK